RITVEDDGPGVPPELRAAIFEPFRQGPMRSPHSPGTGIGLSLVARFAELHGGRAWVESAPAGAGVTLHQGARFVVELAATGEALGDGRRSGEESRPGGREGDGVESMTAGGSGGAAPGAAGPGAAGPGIAGSGAGGAGTEGAARR
ncbi:MAG TPA: ATP-binding protein, partial [Gemmatimonadaceae bacterium]|nr:ATP-binding protein [Gemmatimonadaceae bacterium]